MEDKIKKLHDFLGEMELKLKKISGELNRKPREFWINKYRGGDMYIHKGEESAKRLINNPGYIETIHVREVIDE